MPKRIPTKRKYDSSRRKAQALETHTQVLEAAQNLFIERGYLGTSIESIAQKAGVAPETVYSVFGNKKAVLSQVFNLSVVGMAGDDDNPVPLAVRSYIEDIEAERNQTRQFQMFAKRIQIIMPRTAPILEVMRGAARTEPEIANLLKKYLDDRLHRMGYFIDCVLANGPLRKGIGKTTAAEMVWGLTSAEFYNLLIADLNWSEEEYEVWLADTLIRLLLT
jgi:AcrR family transcriptional regulator